MSKPSLDARIRWSIRTAALVPSVLLLLVCGILGARFFNRQTEIRQFEDAESVRERISHRLELIAERAQALARDSDLLRASQVPIFISKADERLADFSGENGAKEIRFFDSQGRLITAFPTTLEITGSSEPRSCALPGYREEGSLLYLGVPVGGNGFLCLKLQRSAVIEASGLSRDQILRMGPAGPGTEIELLKLRPDLRGGRTFVAKLGYFKDPASRQLTSIGVAMTLMLGGLLFVIGAISSRFARRGVAPLARMSELVSRYAQGDYGAKPEVTPFVETEQLSRTLEKMGGLILTHLAMERERNKAELEALKNQLKPHFLFNSLNSIASAGQTSPDRMIPMIQMLSDLYRMILESSKALEQPIARELAIVRGYLMLEKERYGERLDFTITVAERALDSPIPCLLLQTLVENCIKHGISDSIDGGEVRILGQVVPGNGGERILFEIMNSGERLNPRYEPGTGLENTRRRLDLGFAGQHEFSLDSDAAGWTVARFFLPLGIPLGSPEKFKEAEK